MDSRGLIFYLVVLALFAAATAFVRWRSRGAKSWFSSYSRVLYLYFVGFGIVFIIVAPLIAASVLLDEIGRSDLTVYVLLGILIVDAIIVVVWWRVARRIRRRRLEKELERERSLPFAKLRDL